MRISKRIVYKVRNGGLDFMEHTPMEVESQSVGLLNAQETKFHSRLRWLAQYFPNRTLGIIGPAIIICYKNVNYAGFIRPNYRHTIIVWQTYKLQWADMQFWTWSGLKNYSLTHNTAQFLVIWHICNISYKAGSFIVIILTTLAYNMAIKLPAL